MVSPTIEQILIDVSQYLSQGEAFARTYPRNELSALIKSAVRLGVDAQRAISDIMSDLHLIQRHVGRLRRIWTILIIRCVMIWVGVIFVRVVLLHTIDASVWTVWARTERFLLATALLLTVILIGALTNRYLKRGWGPTLQSRLWSSFCHYVTMGRDHVRCSKLRRNLKKIVIDEWRSGVSGHSARLVLLKNRISAIGDAIDQECASLASVTAAAELSVFALGFIGFNLAPLMAWMESASGVN